MSPRPLTSCCALALLVVSTAAMASEWRTPNKTFAKGCAETAEVTNADDAGPGSLRNAVLGVCTGGLITFEQRFEIQLASEILVEKALTIDGSGIEGEAVDSLVRILGGSEHRSFRVETTGDLTLKSLRVSNGVVGDLGGAIHNRGTLTLLDSRFDGNSSAPLGGLGGGAIFSTTGARLIVDGCTFDRNDSVRGAAIFNVGEAELRNSTFSDNNGDTNEGAIQNRGILLATHITVSNNGREGTPTAGGLFAFNADTTLVNSIFAGNTGRDCFISGGTSAVDGLLANSGNCGQQFSDDPQLQPLAANGGATETRALGAESPAIDAGTEEFCLATDQRGIARPQREGCDLGAFEVRDDAIFADDFEAMVE